MKSFNALEWMARFGSEKKTAVKIGDMKVRLDGLSPRYTDEELAILASRQTEDVRCSVPKVETIGGLEARGSAKVRGDYLAQLIISVTGIGAEEPSDENPATEEKPAPKARAKSAKSRA